MTLAMWILRIVLGSLFLISALRKLRERDQFHTVIFLLTGIFRKWYKRIGDAVLMSEVVIGLSLIANLAPWFSVTTGLALMCVFDVVLVILFVGHPGMACGCFGPQSEKGVRRIDLFRNALITLSFLGLLLWQRSFPSTHQLGANIVVFVLVLTFIAVWEYGSSGRKSPNPQRRTPTGTHDA
jgi:uncharacterized membrane protein YphA (DoxX/SURF4 family)